MADGYVQVPADSTGKKVDAAELTVNAATVERQRVVLGDNADGTAFATITTAGGLWVNVTNATVTTTISNTGFGVTGTATITGLVSGSSVNVTNTVAVTGFSGATISATNTVGVTFVTPQHVIVDSGTSQVGITGTANIIGTVSGSSVNVTNTVVVTGISGSTVAATGTVSVTFVSPQNVVIDSGTVQAGITGTANITGLVSGSSVNVTNAVAVTGTFYQTTQTVALVSTGITGTVNVTGLVSGSSVNVTNTVAITGGITSVPTYGGKTLTFVSLAQGAAGTTTLAAAAAPSKHKIMGGMLTLNAAGTVKFTDSSGDLCGAMDMPGSAGFVMPTSMLPYVETGAVNRPIMVVTTGGAAKGSVVLLTEA